MDGIDFIQHFSPALGPEAAKEKWEMVMADPKSNGYHDWEGEPGNPGLKVWQAKPKERYTDSKKSLSRSYEQATKAQKHKEGEAGIAQEDQLMEMALNNEGLSFSSAFFLGNVRSKLGRTSSPSQTGSTVDDSSSSLPETVDQQKWGSSCSTSLRPLQACTRNGTRRSCQVLRLP